MKIFTREIPVKRLLGISALFFVGILSLLLLCLAFIPAFVSSHSVQSRIKKVLSSTMKRQVGWSSLVMTWSDGLVLSGLKFGDGPAPLLKTDIDYIVIFPSAGYGADGRFGVDLMVRIRNVRAALAPTPQKPSSPSAKDPLTLLAELIQEVQRLDFPLPVDVRAMVEVAPLQISYQAPGSGRAMLLQEFSLRFAMPSLAAKAITAEMDGTVLSSGRVMGAVHCAAKVSDLVTPGQRIHLASALFAVDATAPGTSIALTGGLSHVDGFAARLKLDLPRLLAVAEPLAPPGMPKLEGGVELLLRAKADAHRDIHATLTVDGAGLAASGGSLKEKRVGPLDLKLQQRIATDHIRQQVDFSGGTFSMAGLIDTSWSASVIRPDVPERTLNLRFGPLRLDLARALALAAPFLPPGSPVKDLAGDVSLRSLSLHLNGPGNRGDVALAGFGVTIPRLRLALARGELTAEHVELLLEKAVCPLTAALPTGLTADLVWNIRHADLSGAQPLSVQEGRGTTGIVVSNLNLKSGASPRKISATVVVTQTGDLGRASLGTQLVVETVHEQFRIVARAGENGDIDADLPECTITAASIKGLQSGKRVGPLPLSSSLTATGLHIPSATSGRTGLQHAAATLSVGDIMQLTTTAAFSAASPSSVMTSGTARLDVRRAVPFAAPFMPSGMKGDGVVNAVWDVTATLPEKTPVFDKNPLRSVRTGLSQCDKLDFGLKFDNLNVTLPSANGNITVSGLCTKPDLHIFSTKKGESARLEGGVLFSGVSGLSGTAGQLPAQHGSFAVTAELSGWKALHLNEELHIEPLAISHEGELSVSRIDLLLDESEPFNRATLAKRLDATLLAHVEGIFPREFRQLLPGFDVAGEIGGSTRIDLTAGRELVLRGALKTKEFGVRLANGTTVEGVRSDIAINRVYSLTSASQSENWIPLSTALVRPAVALSTNPGAAEIAGRINDDLRGDVHGARSFSIRRIVTKASGVPLELTALEGDLLFTQEKCGLGFLQAELLGGTLLARGVFDLRPEVPVIAAASSFSNLDMSLLLPKEARAGQGGQDTEITGEMSLTAPLTVEQRELFEQLRLAVTVRRIGAKTIERALFSLDPYERNEQVVAQRKMLRLGSLKGLRATAVDGAFSMEGEARIKGVSVDLPKVERLRISELPLRKELVENRAVISSLRGVLDLLRADTLVVDPKGELSLKRRMYAQ